MQPEIKSRAFCITSWREPEFRPNTKIKFLIWQTEWSTTGKLHWQTYIEFENSYTFQQVKNIMKDKTVHVEIARENRLSNIWYCTKTKSYAGHRKCIDFTVNKYGREYEEKIKLQDEIFQTPETPLTFDKQLDEFFENGMRL